MRKKMCLIVLLNVAVATGLYAQKVRTFEQAAQEGKSYQQLDKLYKSAVHADTKLAVFKTPEEQQSLQKTYINFMQGLGVYLKANNFTWDKPQVRCFNRIYFAKNGKVEYFLYRFPPDEISVEKEKEFARLLNSFVKGHQFGLTATEPFAQCSPIKYND